MNRSTLIVGSLILLFTAVTLAEERMTVWGLPPRQEPHRTKAAEGMPPLPLPVVPQRRTEKKRPPSPPKLLANVVNFSFDVWQGSPGSVDQLLKNGRRFLEVWYGWENLDIHQLVRQHQSGVTYRTPIIYFCAYYPLNLDDEQRTALRSYALAGGTILINCCGQRESFESAKAEIESMFPHHPLRQLPPDHPMYHAYYTIETITYPLPSDNPLDTGAAETGVPRLRAVTLGTRAAVIVSFEDMACGWNEWNNPAVHRVDSKDSTRLGLNIVTYVTAEQRLAKFLSHTTEVAGPTMRPRQQLEFVQIIHDGNWDPNPSAVPLFLKELASNTSIAVRFEHRELQLKDPALFMHPLLYMTGSWDPQLSRDEMALLHRYLTSGGTLISDSASGRIEYDEAFRKVCAQLFPEHPLEPLSADHPLFNCFHQITQASLNHEANPIVPHIEAVIVDGRPVILYSPLGLSDGWAHLHSAYARCYTTGDALKLGANMVVFAMQ
jgi:hypothetical protein